MSTPSLWNHQKLALERSQTEPCLALFWDVGTGKTRATIDMIRYRCAAHNRLMRVLILAPKITLLNWKREIAKYSKIHPRDVVILEGSGAKRAQTFRDATLEDHLFTKSKIIITNYESLQMESLYTQIMDWKPEIIVGDEAHRLKNPESKRAKLAIKLRDKCAEQKHFCTYALTGTPVLDGKGLDLFNIFRFLDGGRTFGVNFWRFRSVWFEDENARWAGDQNYFPKWVPRPDAYQEFNNLVYQRAIRAIKSECLDLPPFVRKEVHVELSPEQKRLYKDMKDEYLAYIDDILKTDKPRAVVAQLAVTKALRLMQIVTGYAKTEDGDIYKIEKNPRLDALSEMLEDMAPNHKIIVWSVFHENYADIAGVCQKLNLPYTELHGKVHQKDRDRNIDKFNQDPDCRVLIANQAAGGIGINLVASDISIFYSKNFSLEQDIQAEGRNYRGGSEQHHKVTRIDIVATGTIDELIAESLANKQAVGEKILDWKEKL
jgi:SNF2 family DNA or RNA helicase